MTDQIESQKDGQPPIELARRGIESSSEVTNETYYYVVKANDTEFYGFPATTWVITEDDLSRLWEWGTRRIIIIVSDYNLMYVASLDDFWKDCEQVIFIGQTDAS